MDTIENLKLLKNFVDDRRDDPNADMILNTISDTLSSIIDKMEKNHNIDQIFRQMISK